MRLLELLTARPCMAEPLAFRKFLEIVAREHAPGRAKADTLPISEPGKPTESRSLSDSESGVAVIEVFGPIVRHADLFTDICGGTTTQRLAADLKAAVNDPSIKAIVLHMDTPGGEATGIQELAASIRAATAIKPVVAYVEGMGASAGYYLASAASEIVCDPTAMLGSIGVVIGYTDTKKLDAAIGIENIEIVSSQSPKKRLDPTTDEGRFEYQRWVDDLAAVFVSDVAKYRSVSQKTVLSDFGQGGLLIGKRAVKAGLADRLGSRDSLIDELSAGTWRRPSRSASPPTARADAGQTSPKPRGSSAMGFLDYLKNLYDSDAATAEAGAESASEASEVTPVATPKLATLIQGETLKPIAGIEDLKRQLAERDSRETELKAQVEKLVADATERELKAKADAEDARVSALEAAAASFAEKVVADKRAFPAEQSALATLYIDAAEGDHERPRAEGKSRVEALAEACNARPPHALDDASMDGRTLPKGAKVIPLQGNGDAEAEAKRARGREFIAKRNADTLAARARAQGK